MNAIHEMRVLNLTASVSRDAGGLFESVRHLAQATHIPGRCRVSAVGLRDDHTTADLPRWAPVEVRAMKTLGPQRFGYAPGMLPALFRAHADLVHLHGLWKFPSLAAFEWARRTGRPYLLSPHGMLEPWALEQSRRLKHVALRLYQRRCLRQAACLRATSDLECASIRRAGLSNPVAIVPNGVELPSPLPPRPQPVNGQKRCALFLSRVHPKKGLLNLVRAWSLVRPAGWELVVAGPDESGHLAEIETEIRARGLDAQIRFTGPVWGEARTALYAASELFVLPSFSENFGLVIAEALSCRVPVITTRATPWSRLEAHRCGWWIDTGVEPLTHALREALNTPPELLAEMGRRGRSLVESHFTWPIAGRQMLELYEWVLGKCERPDFVRLAP